MFGEEELEAQQLMGLVQGLEEAKNGQGYPPRPPGAKLKARVGRGEARQGPVP